MKKLTFTTLAVFICFISFAQNESSSKENMMYLENNINKFNLVHASTYQAGYSMTYSYEYFIEDGIFKEVATYVSTKQEAISTANLKDLIKIEKDIQDGKHETLLLTFKKDAVSYVSGNFKEKQHTISIQFCTNSEQNANNELNCKKAKHTLQDKLVVEVIQSFQKLIQ